ncbi:hypothetical protein PENSPDRAFT_651834 [Peniophora sp. CONT]|nr:hypothetical protein PENSPDRAFT_651834 [Peniophora sp. CONT]
MDSDGYISDRDTSPSEPESIAEDNPGARTLWFGKHDGKRLDEVDEGYIAWACHPKRRTYAWYNDFKQLCNEYRQWRKEHFPDENPGNAIVWWGRYEGQEFRKMYSAYGHMNFILQSRFKGCRWYFWLTDHTKRYKAWLNHHRRSRQPRVSTGYRRDIGERVDSRDDPVPPQEEYERDDFLVSDTDSVSGADIDSEDDMVTEEEPETLEDEVKNLRYGQEQSSPEDGTDEAVEGRSPSALSDREGEGDDEEDRDESGVEDEVEGEDEDADDESDFDVQYDPANKKARQEGALARIKAKRPVSAQLVSPLKVIRELSSRSKVG